MNKFGGDWTEIKIDILVKYAKAYLKIMNTRRFFKLLYFDGFAGSGFIVKSKSIGLEMTVGAAKRIIELDDPISFDTYYFVEKKPKNFKLLKKNTVDAFLKKKIYTVCDDCNKKLVDLAIFLRDPKNKNYRTLAYIDPCGMQLEWRSIENLKGLDIDMWILVPTGLGVNRLLKNNGDISDMWMGKLELFLGMEKEDIEKYFYKETATPLFPDLTVREKEKNVIEKSAQLYKRKLEEVFKYVSNPYPLKNTTGTVMYHLFLSANNKTAVSIGNSIIEKYNL